MYENDQLDPDANYFIQEVYDMVALNFKVFTFDIKPKTRKSFELTLGYNNKTATKIFKHYDLKSPKGIFKVAEMIAFLDKES